MHGQNSSQAGKPSRANRLVLTTQDHRLFLYDLTSGQLVRTFDPFFWSVWSLWCALVAYSVWCLAWLFVSAKCHPHAWLDFAVCSGLVVAFYTTLYYSDYMVCVGIFASWTHVAMTWLIFGKTCWSLRFQPLLLLAGTTTGIMHLLPLESDDKTLSIFISGHFSPNATTQAAWHNESHRFTLRKFRFFATKTIFREPRWAAGFAEGNSGSPARKERRA